MLSEPAHPARLIKPRKGLRSVYRTQLGQLYRGDCLEFLLALPDASVDMAFADPPFNLGKDYGPGITDAVRMDEYLTWSRDWLGQLVRVLRPGGALFVFNLPQWLIEYGAFLNARGMSFRHWIAMRMPKAFPRGKKLSPAHYGCLYYTKGVPKTFNKVYVPIPTCRHCGGEIRDYGGHRKSLNEKGLNLMDIFDSPEDVWEAAPHPLPRGHGWTEAEEMWDDIPPVRHSKYKVRGANELAPIMLERIVALSTNRADLVIDPFGGSGTTYFAAERLGRRWLGVEIGDTGPAIQRMKDLKAGLFLPWERARGVVPKVRTNNGKSPNGNGDQLRLLGAIEKNG